LSEVKSMQKSEEPKLSSDFQVQVKISYIPEESRPETNYHFFAYKIFITNRSQKEAQLMSRHWVITDGFGQTEEIRGAGVVGQQPKIKPGQTFEYESACPLSTSSGSMRGTYQLVGDNGEQFDIEIPEFYLIAPSALH
jgi:ApaG protein